MIRYVIIFFALALLAAFFGFGGLAADFVGVAKFLTVLFVVLFVISLIFSVLSGKKGESPPL